MKITVTDGYLFISPDLFSGGPSDNSTSTSTAPEVVELQIPCRMRENDVCLCCDTPCKEVDDKLCGQFHFAFACGFDKGLKEQMTDE